MNEPSEAEIRDYEDHADHDDRQMNPDCPHCWPEPPPPKRFKWTVEFEVDETWVADGFNLTTERAQRMIAKELGWARSSEIGARTVEAPDPKDIRKAQGYAE